jgi:hypothetical protein
MPDGGALTIPAIIGGVSALASGGAGVANAVNQGNNKGTAPIDQSVGQMDQNAFGYGGGIQSQQQQALQGQFQQAQQANHQAQSDYQQVAQQMQLAQQAMGKGFWQRTPEEKAAIEQMAQNASKLPQLAKNAQVAGAAFKDIDQKMQNAPNLAQSEANRYQQAAGAADQRQGVQMNLDHYNQARGETQNAVGLSRAAAEGNAPSVAQMQLRQGLDQANNQAAGMAAGARGGGGNLALAARSAIQQQGQNAMTTNQNAAMLRANEMATARGQYMQGAQGMQTTDLAQSGQQAALDAQQRNLNDARNQYYEGGLQRIYGAQQAGQSGYQQQQASNRIGIEQANRKLADARFSDQQGATSGAIQAGGRALEGLARIPGAFNSMGGTGASTGTEDDVHKGAANPW